MSTYEWAGSFRCTVTVTCLLISTDPLSLQCGILLPGQIWSLLLCSSLVKLIWGWRLMVHALMQSQGVESGVKIIYSPVKVCKAESRVKH